MKRIFVVLILSLGALAVGSTIHIDGELKPVRPTLAVAIRDSEGWYAYPIVGSRADDARSVYIVAPVLPSGENFPAVRIDTVTGEQTAATVRLGPRSPLRTFMPAGAQAGVRGVHFGRPALHLLSFPEGKGPGVHRVDSATGRLVVKSGERMLLTRYVFNSSTTPELLSLVSADPNGRWLALLTRREGGGWKVFLFARNQAHWKVIAERHSDETNL